MKQLPLPKPNDVLTLFRLAKNRRLSSYPELGAEKRRIAQRYKLYRELLGDPHKIPVLGLSNSLAKSLKAHYSSPPQLIGKRFQKVRESLSPRVCSMCGAPNPGTLDHVLPKDIYPEFSIFLLNLVPACLCNIKRGVVYRGVAPDQRVLHPYFDTCLNHRIVRIRFEDPSEAPKVSLEICAPLGSPMGEISFHAENVLKKTNILAWCSDYWGALVRGPDRILTVVPRPPALCAEEDLRLALSERLSQSDNSFGTPNNWESMFFAGILSSQGFVRWLTQRANSIRFSLIEPS